MCDESMQPWLGRPDEEMPALEDEEETAVETTVGGMQKGASEAA